MSMIIEINPDKCQSCGMCQDYCTTGAIEVESGNSYNKCFINKNLCIGCGNCLKVDCPGDAIREVVG